MREEYSILPTWPEGGRKRVQHRFWGARVRAPFDELQTSLGVANVLTARLNRVSDAGLFERAYLDRSPRFEYVLTQKRRDPKIDRSSV